MSERRGRVYAQRMAPEVRREQLLDAVLHVIVEQGVHKVSIDTVAKKAGVSRPVVYGLFTDSEQLLRASLDREEVAALAQMAASVPSAAGSDPVQAVSDSVAHFLTAVLDAPDRWRAIFLIADASTPAFRRRIEGGRQAFIAALATFVKAATPPERLPWIDVELTARALHTLFWEAGRLVLADPESFPPQRIRTFASTLIPALPAFRDLKAPQ